MDTLNLENAASYEIFDDQAVKQAKAAIPCEAAIEKLADFYKIMGDPTRLKILTALEAGELCVSDLAVVVNMSRSAISHQLRALKAAKLVCSRREGKTVYYGLDDEHIHSIIKVAFAHICEEE
ncbi:winged helix-turn-helix transcriptional regulator [Erysipelotrichaceae bacterium RD49]|nr:winged helix-turn-helix transcriptional regulator [Erysipelotrichaceae bacterium RD49]